MTDKTKIAILGGGVGAMTAAFQLTRTEGWRDAFEITVYQRGWRLGGKGASGRGPGGRIEEHGLHVWGGYYDNAFRVLGEAYAVADRPSSCPAHDIASAFAPLASAWLSELQGDTAEIYELPFGTNDAAPGSGNLTLSAVDYLRELLSGLRRLLALYRDHGGATPPHAEAHWPDLPADLRAHADKIPKGHRTSALHAAAHVSEWLPREGGRRSGPLHRLIDWLLDRLAGWLAGHGDGTGYAPPVRAMLAGLHIGAACARGMIAGEVLIKGFDVLDDEEWTAWCMRHGAPEWAMRTAVGRCSYDYVFGSHAGHATFENRSVAAGVGMRGLLRLLFTYKGALFYKMNGGMGDIVFAPLYEALVKKGVRFAFFHDVRDLGLDPAGEHVEEIRIGRQATLRDPAAGYHPLIEVGGLPSWPAEPLYDQLVEGKALKDSGADLESIWSDWRDVEEITLRRGAEFDLVIFGISLGAVPVVASDLVARHPAWARMVEKIATVPTQAMQLWLDKPLSELRAPSGAPADGAVLTAFFEPLDTWADMSFLLAREAHGHAGPRQISYACAVFEETEAAPPPGPSPYPKEQLDAVIQGAGEWLDTRLPGILPGAAGPDGRFDRALLSGGFDAQYFRANVDPSERYVQSPPGSTAARLPADASGVVNLFLAGDWLRTGLNAGCVEAAAMGGLQAARAISGRDVPIVGERDVSVSDLAAPNAPLPWNSIYARGDITGAVVTLPLPKAQAQALLPRGLKLMPQSAVGPGDHPVAVILSDQSGVRTNLAAAGGLHYQEAVYVVPYVEFENPDDGPPGPFMYYPHLYLNSTMATLEGRWFYGFDKSLARIEGGPRAMTVYPMLLGHRRLSACLKADGPPGHYYEFDHILHYLPMVDQPVLGRTFLGDWVFSYLSYDVEEGRITALEGDITLGAGELGFAQGKVIPVRSVRALPVGAFEFTGSWTLTNPLESATLKEILEDRRHGA